MKVINRIGQGGFGNVDKVELDSGEICARKEFAQNQPLTPDLLVNVKKRFAKEVKVQSAIKHPNIVRVLESNLDADPPHYLMPLADCSLSDDLAKDRVLGGSFVSAISDVVAALEELHSMEIYHRDLKPQNVLRFSKDGTPIYAVSDFGLISMKESNLSELTKSGMGKGSDFYTAPEIANDLRTASVQSDIYSLGCILHDMVGHEARVPFREIKEDGDFGAILGGCTKDDPKKRFPSAKAVLDAILTVEFTPSGEVSVGTEDYLNMLSADQPPDAVAWRRLADYLSDKATEADVAAICGKMTADRIETLCKADPDSANEIGVIYAEWVSRSAFVFEHCDAIANRAEVFFENGGLELKVDCLMALLKMGTRHNRWFVERKFVDLCGPEMDENLAKRMVVKCYIEGSGTICSSIAHLEGSIDFNREQFHQRIVNVLSELCV